MRRKVISAAMSNPITFLKDTFPRLFHKGVEGLEAKVAEGNEKAGKILADVKGAAGHVVLVVEGEGEVYMKYADGKMQVIDAKPTQDVKLAVAAPGPAVKMLLGEAEKEGELEEGKAAKRAVRTVSKRVQDALGAQSLLFHVNIENVPDHGTVTVKVGLNAPEPPQEPKFKATIAFADLEAARAGEVNAQMLFMGGKLRMEGDYSAALQLGMQLMAQAQQDGF